MLTAIDLEIYRRQNGKYPSSLETVYPDGKLPEDIFDPEGSPLHYSKDSDHSYRIWSVGENGIDDGGTDLGFRRKNLDFGYEVGKKDVQAPVFQSVNEN